MKKKMMKALSKHLHKETEHGESTALLFAQAALFATSVFLRKTAFYSKHDAEGLKTALFYHIIALLLSYSKHLGRLKFLKRTCGFKVNLIGNFICFLLAILFEKFYEKSSGSLGVALSAAVLFLALLVIIRPSTDLGILGFILGAAGSVAYNLFGLITFRIWVIAATCFVLFGFKCWLDHNWLELDEDELLRLPSTTTTTRSTVRGNHISSKSNIIEALMVTGFYLDWDCYLIRDKGQVKGLAACLVILVLWGTLAIVPRFYALLRLSNIRNEMDEVFKELVENTKSIPGAKVENNKFRLSVHYRSVDEKNWSELALQVKTAMKEYPKLKLTQGRKVLEIRPRIKWDKGALEFMLRDTW